jgi:hypothetical protein
LALSIARFLIPIRIGVPPGGLGQRHSQITAWLDENCGADGWAMTPSGTRGVVNDAVSIYFADATLGNAFVARWCVGARVEATRGVFQVREDEPAPRAGGDDAPDSPSSSERRKSTPCGHSARRGDTCNARPPKTAAETNWGTRATKTLFTPPIQSVRWRNFSYYSMPYSREGLDCFSSVGVPNRPREKSRVNLSGTKLVPIHPNRPYILFRLAAKPTFSAAC